NLKNQRAQTMCLLVFYDLVAFTFRAYVPAQRHTWRSGDTALLQTMTRSASFSRLARSSPQRSIGAPAHRMALGGGRIGSMRARAFNDVWIGRRQKGRPGNFILRADISCSRDSMTSWIVTSWLFFS